MNMKNKYLKMCGYKLPMNLQRFAEGDGAGADGSNGDGDGEEGGALSFDDFLKEEQSGRVRPKSTESSEHCSRKCAGKMAHHDRRQSV